MAESVESVGLAVAARVAAKPRRGALIAIAVVLSIVTNAVAFMVPPLLPLLQAQFKLGVSASGWIFTALTLGGGAGFVLIPRLADVLGDRATGLLSCVALTVGALAPAVVHTYPVLLTGSALMGFGTAAMMLPLSFLRRHLGDGAVATAVAVLVMASGAGIVGGMVGGGLIVKSLPLTTFFLVLAGIFAVTTVAVVLVIPSGRPESSGRIGVPGAAWMVAWVTLVLLALTQGLAWGWAALALLVAGLAGGVSWALAQRRSPSALFDVKLMKKPYFTTACLSAGLFGAIDAALLLLVSYYTQTPADAGYGLGMDALGTGLIMMPFALMMFVGGKAAEKAVQRGRPGTILVVGAAICAAGLALLAVAHSSVWEYLAGAALVGLGSRLGYSGAFAITQLVVPESEAGMAGGMSGTTMSIGYAFGSAVITGLLTVATVGDTGLPQPYLYTVGYLVTLGFSLLVLIATVISRLRYRGDFRDLLAQA